MISVIIPSKNEPYLQQTVEDIKRNAVTDIEVLVGDDAVLKLGQRGVMNHLARTVKGEYILKTDAHCSFGPGFDEILLKDIKDNEIVAPFLLPLNAEQWSPASNNRHAGYIFDTNLVMHHAPITNELMQETMCLQGSFFLTKTENYWNWNLCDESLGSWGGQGVEIGIKAFLNGGRCVTNKKTYYLHLFRHKEEDFPYERKQEDIDASHAQVLSKLKTQAIAPLIEKWNYPLDWTPEIVSALPRVV
jgi:hypothetical protein